MVLYLSLPADYSMQKRANGASATSGETNSLATENRSSLQNGPSTKTAERPADERVQATPPKLYRAAETTDSSERAELGKTWSVQISAAPTKNVADKLAQQLKAKGYDGYVSRRT